MSTLHVIKRPILSERSTSLAESFNQVVFEVALDATKPQIRKAVETHFKVKIASINTSILPGKAYRTKAGAGKTNSWKKAIVTLKAGEKIEFFKGV